MLHNSYIKKETELSLELILPCLCLSPPRRSRDPGLPFRVGTALAMLPTCAWVLGKTHMCPQPGSCAISGDTVKDPGKAGSSASPHSTLLAKGQKDGHCWGRGKKSSKVQGKEAARLSAWVPACTPLCPFAGKQLLGTRSLGGWSPPFMLTMKG